MKYTHRDAYREYELTMKDEGLARKIAIRAQESEKAILAPPIVLGGRLALYLLGFGDFYYAYWATAFCCLRVCNL